MADPFVIEFDYRTKRYKDAVAGLRAFSKDLDQGFAAIPNILREELKKYLDAVALALYKRHGNPWPAGTTGTSLSRRSGNLISTIRGSVKVYGKSIDDIGGSISAPFYARTHENGATIRPKKAKYLTIPLPAALNANGTPKKRRARDWQNTFIMKSKAGNLLIVQRNGKDIVPLYVLKTSVKIPRRLLMGKTLRTGIPYFVDSAVERMLKEIQAGLT